MVNGEIEGKRRFVPLALYEVIYNSHLYIPAACVLDIV